MAHEGTVPNGAAPENSAHHAPGRITRVILKNYKSIVSCDVELQPLTILVGPNGSGKSNFLDALAFVSEALTVGLEQAIRNRGNIDRILSAARTPGDDSFSIELHFQLATGVTGRYGFEISANHTGAVLTEREWLETDGQSLFDRAGGESEEAFSEKVATWAVLERGRLYLVAYSAYEGARPAYDLLTSMTFYNPLPDVMRSPVEHDVAPHLHADGRNAASMVRRFQTADSEELCGVLPYLRRVLPGLESIVAEDLRGYDALFFRLRAGSKLELTEFAASQMSDGTLRALAVLLALFQSRLGGRALPSLVGIEEPENNIHPAAARIVLAAMQSESYDTQVLATTHSADMLHMGDADLNSILVVFAEDGVTQIGPVDAVSQSIVRDHIYTLGELMQMDQLKPEPPTPASNGGDVSAPAFGRL